MLHLPVSIFSRNAMKNLRKILAVLPVLGLLGCSPADVQNSHITQGLVYCSEGNPVSFNPQLIITGTTVDATSNQLYNRLLEYNPTTGRLEAALADSWQISADGRTYTFTLRRDVQFHETNYFKPSRPLTAEDVVFSFNRVIRENHPFHFVSGGNYPFFQSVDFMSLIDNIEAIGPHQVRFHLVESDSSFLANLATDFSVILSAEYGQQLLDLGTPELIDSAPVGTGPFVFTRYYKNNHIRYKRNDRYWGGPPQIDQLVYDITPKSTNRIAKLLTGDCDVSALPQASELSVLREQLELELQVQTGLNVAYWAFNTQRPPFDNVKIRRALAMAINKKAIIDAVYYGSGTTAKSILPPLSWAYDHALEEYRYDPDAARTLLREAGYPQGFEMTLWAPPVQRIYNPNAIKMAELIQAQLADIGIQVQIVSYDWSIFVQKLHESTYDSVLMGWTADNADPDNFFRPQLSCASLESGNNRANWCEPEFDLLIHSAITQQDHDARRLYYVQAQRLLHDEVPLVPITHAMRFQVKDREIHGMPLNPYGGISFAKSHREAKRN